MRQPGTPELDHHDRVAAALHWLIGLALLGQLAFGFLLDDIAPRGTPARAGVVNLHKSLGIVLGLAILARIAWRLGHRPPAWPDALGAWQRRAARLMHGALYACIAVLPASGFVASNLSRHGVRLFGWSLGPWGPDLPAAYAALARLHVAAGWLLVVLVGLHVLAALRHAFLRDGVFGRMWPWAPRTSGADGPGVTDAPRRRRIA